MKKYGFYIFFAWLLPGSGHFLLGHRIKGLLLFLLVVPTYLFGAYMIDFSLYFLARNQFYLTLSCFIGLPMSVFAFVNTDISTPMHVPLFLNTGFLYMAVASLINILLCFRVFFILQMQNSISGEK